MSGILVLVIACALAVLAVPVLIASVLSQRNHACVPVISPRGDLWPCPQCGGIPRPPRGRHRARTEAQILPELNAMAARMSRLSDT